MTLYTIQSSANVLSDGVILEGMSLMKTKIKVDPKLAAGVHQRPQKPHLEEQPLRDTALSKDTQPSTRLNYRPNCNEEI